MEAIKDFDEDILMEGHAESRLKVDKGRKREDCLGIGDI